METNNTGNNMNGHKITFLELVLNILAFGCIADIDYFHWWFFIIGFFISIFLAYIFDAEKYDKVDYIVGFIIVFFAALFSVASLPLWTGLIIWPVFYSIMVFIISKVKATQTTCDKCKKEYAMEVYDTEFLGSENISITKEHVVTDVYGKEHTNYYEVPGRREYYRDHRRCKFCGYEDTIRYSRDYENG